MITQGVAITICLFILGITFTLMRLIYNIIIERVKKLESSRDNHEKRIQHIEDLHGRDINEIKRILTELSADVKALDKYIHKDNHDIINLMKSQNDIMQSLQKQLNI